MQPKSPEPPLEPTADWTPAPPEFVPAPSVWPAAVSLGATFMLWGLVSSLLITGVGLIVFIIGLSGWIGEIRHDRKRD